MLLHHKVTGTGEPVILLHGLFGSLENLGGVARYLSDYFEVHSLDLRNHGRSKHDNEHTYSAMSDDVLSYIEHNQLSQVRLLGHSMGGKVAMQLALNHPDKIKQIIVADIAPITYEHHHHDVFNGFNAVKLDEITSRHDADCQMQPHIIEKDVRSFILKNLIKKESGYAWRCNLSVLIDQYGEVLKGQQGPAFNKPVLFIKGGDSPYIDDSHTDAILGLFPKAQVRVITGTSHWLHAQKPQVFSALAKRFFTQV
jgi:esterase